MIEIEQSLAEDRRQNIGFCFSHVIAISFDKDMTNSKNWLLLGPFIRIKST